MRTSLSKPFVLTKALPRTRLCVLGLLLLALSSAPAAWGQSRHAGGQAAGTEDASVGNGPVAARVGADQHEARPPAPRSHALQNAPEELRQAISLRVQDVTLAKALERVAEEGDLDLIYGSHPVLTRKTVSLRLEEVPVREALEEVLRGSGLGLVSSRSGRLILVKTGLSRMTPRALKSRLSGLKGMQQVKAATLAPARVPVQTGTIAGTVTDSTTGAPLPGVNVVIEGTQQGASTDGAGRYTIPGVEAGTYAVQASFVGYASKTVEGMTVSDDETTTVDVALRPSTIALDEVVAIGYGTQQRRDLTGSVSSVSAEELTEMPSTNPLESLQGKVSGLNISNNSGRPGSSISVNLRGFTSINASNNPLFVVDGVVGANPDFLNPNNIQSVQVLKDASASAIYGTRAANGVVIIQTKDGTPGDLQVSYSNNVGAATMARKIDVLNATEFMDVLRDAYRYDPEREMPNFAEDYPSLFNPDGTPIYDTDWQEAATRTALSQRHNLSVTGGSDNASLALSLGYQDVEGILLNTWLKKYSARLSSNLTLRSWITLDANLAYNRTDENRIDDYSVGAQIPTRTMVEEFPIIPLRSPNGEYSRSYQEGYDFLGRTPRENTVRLLKGISRRHDDAQLLGNANLTLDLTDNLSFETTLGVEQERYELRFYGGRDLFNYSATNGGEATISNNDILYWQSENFLTYENSFGDHSITGLLGVSWSKQTSEDVTASAYGFADDAYRYDNLGVASNPQPPSSNYADETLNSSYARINYRLMDKYLVTATGRYDGSSKFGSGNKYAFFPSIALGWILSEEPFLEGADFLSNLKLRFSSGITGNSAIGAYSSLGATGTYSVAFGDERFTGIAQGIVPNNDLRWETTTQHNIGLDVALSDSRINFSTDVYLKTTDDLLLQNPIPYVSGYGTVFENVGKTQNYGIEMSLQTQNIDAGDFDWSSNVNFSANRNKILALGDDNADIFPGPYFLGPTNILRVGESVGSFWGYVRKGTWNTDEAEEAARYGKRPGDKKLLDVNGDFAINDADRQIIGNAYPDFTAFLSNTFEYKNWALGVDIEVSYGNDVLNMNHHALEDRIGIANNVKSILDAWTPENQDTPISSDRIATLDSYSTQVDTRWVEDGSFIRGQNLNLSYTLSDELVSRIGFQQARISANLQNFFLITSYSGYDPEVSTYGNTFAQGIEFFGYPKSRAISLGVNLQF